MIPFIKPLTKEGRALYIPEYNRQNIAKTH